MFRRLWHFILHPHTLAVLGVLALCALLFLGAQELRIAAWIAAAATIVVVLVSLGVWVIRRRRAAASARALEQALDDDAEQATLTVRAADRPQAQVLRERMQSALQTIRRSRLGQHTGRAALYELPWYLVIGNPAAGKSSAIVHSGLNFPLATEGGGMAVSGVGGTRHCDWFFTSEGILIDTAGRYAVHEEDQPEWLGFLSLLRKHRPRAPINGLVVCVSVSELARSKPEAAVVLAKRLRQRIQEVTERLEVVAPLYLVFTKADLINGFVEFFEDFERHERDKVWGATFPYDTGGSRDAVRHFERHFDELRDGLREIAVARLAHQRGESVPAGLLTFPLEFAAVKPAISAFVATLFEDNPYQFQPVFRGFYFTSALQEGVADNRAGETVARQFGLDPRAPQVTARVSASDGMFLKGLFRQVIFADKALVRQHTSPARQRLRLGVLAASVAGLALALGAWTWSAVGNRQLAQDVAADLDKAQRLQIEQPDLAGRLQALGVLQARLEQLREWKRERPWSVSLGLYQGESLERHLTREYHQGIRSLMLEPVQQALEGHLQEVNRHAKQRGALMANSAPSTATAAVGGASPSTPPAAQVNASVADAGGFAVAAPDDAEAAYNALKTYLMLSDRTRLDPAHLRDQLPRYWRQWLVRHRGNLPAASLQREAEQVIAFSLSSLDDPTFPVLSNNLALVDDTRATLRAVMRGKPAIERVYGVVRARAATRYAPVTVASLIEPRDREVLAGSQVVSGAFTRQAWDEYVQDAFKAASEGELRSADWVLGTQMSDDASIAGSPAQVRAALTDLYKTEYVREWQRFLQGVTVTGFNDLPLAVQHLDRLSDGVASPLRRVLVQVNDQTAWDNPALLNERLNKASSGVVDWFKRSILRQAPARIEVGVDVRGAGVEVPLGPIGREFAGLHRLMAPRDTQAPPVDDYLKALGAVRARFLQVKQQGDPGPLARRLMGATLEGSSSELTDAVRMVDERLLSGMTDSLRQALRPLLVRPMQQAFSTLVAPTEVEINRAWAAQVMEPFESRLANRFPFTPNATVEAVPQEIAKVFGPAGAVARFGDETLGPLVLRRGDALTPRTWLDMGVRLQPVFTEGFGRWVAPLDGAAASASVGDGVTRPAEAQTTFQIWPQGAPGLMEYSVEIDGQVLRHRNMAATWTTFQWPHPTPQPGVRLSGVTLEGRTVELLNVPGRFGLQRMFEAAQRQRRADGVHELTWSGEGKSVTLWLRIVSQAGEVESLRQGSGSAGAGPGGLRGLRLPAAVAGEGAAR